MNLIAGYTPQTRPLRRIAQSLVLDHKASVLKPACAGCGVQLKELARARVFAKREDGQRYRCDSCGNRYISFMGNLLKL